MRTRLGSISKALGLLPHAAARLAGSLAASGWLRTSRTAVASIWRNGQRLVVVLLGFLLFCAVQAGVGYGIINEKIFLTIVGIGLALLIVLLARWPFAACTVWIVGSPYARYFLEFKLAKGIPMLTFDSIVLYALAAVLLLRAMKNRNKLRGLEAGEVLLLAYMLFVILNMAMRGELNASSARHFCFTGIGLWAVAYYVFRSAIRTKDQVVKLAIALVCAAAWAGLTFIYEAQSGKSFYSVVLGTDINLRWNDVGQGRSVGVFSDPVDPGHFLIASVFLALHLMLYTKKAYAKFLYFAAAIAITAGLYYTYTRNNYICLVLVALLMPLLARGRRTFYAALVPVLLAIVVVVGVIALSDAELNKRFTASTLEGRFIANRTAMSVIRHNPLFGVGYLNTEEATMQYITSRKQLAYFGVGGLKTPLLVHNTYLQMFQEEGIVGGMLYYGAVMAFIVLGWRTWRRLPSDGVLGKDLVAVLLASSAAWLVSGLTYRSEFNIYANGVFLMLFAFVVRLKALCLPESAAQSDDACAIGVSKATGREAGI